MVMTSWGLFLVLLGQENFGSGLFLALISSFRAKTDSDMTFWAYYPEKRQKNFFLAKYSKKGQILEIKGQKLWPNPNPNPNLRNGFWGSLGLVPHPLIMFIVTMGTTFNPKIWGYPK